MELNVSRESLLEKLRANKKTHRQKYEKALMVFRDEAVKELDSLMSAVKAGKLVHIVSRLPLPEEHTSDYDAAIGLLEMSSDRLIPLTNHEYETYVLDRWEWARSFASNTMRYSG